MPYSNGNLALVERKALQPGSVVSWQREGMETEEVGTVSEVHGATLILTDGREVLGHYFCRLMDGQPPVASPVSAPAGDEEAEGGLDPEADHSPNAGPDDGAKPGLKRGSEAYRAAWVDAVLAVQARMAAGEKRDAALEAVAQGAPVRVTLDTYAWWRRRLAKDGLLKPGATAGVRSQAVVRGRKKGPARRDVEKTAEEVSGLTDMLTDLRKQVETLTQERDTAQKEAEALREESLQLRADRGALQRTLEDLQAAGGQAEGESTGPVRVSLRETIAAAEALMRELIVALCLADLGRQAGEDLVGTLRRLHIPIGEAKAKVAEGKA